MSSIIENYQSEKNFTENFRNFFKIYKLSTALRKANAYKKRGYSVVEIFSYLFQLVFYNGLCIWKHWPKEMKSHL